jgi:CheY-like chemotaxis protein
LLAFKANEKKIELGYVIEPEVPEAFIGDVTRVRQIIVNLLGNALKFTQEGEVVVSVKIGDAKYIGELRDWRETPNNPPSIRIPLHFSVRDTGIGIPQSRMDRLFQSFSQVDASTTRKYGGTGLGLAISKRLAEIMGGTMWVESTMGVGSTFHFTIQAIPTLRPTKPEEFNLVPLMGKRMLIVDDNATNRRVLTLQAKTWKMEPIDFESPHAAIEAVKQGLKFDIGVFDMQMPEMDGVMLAAALRQIAVTQPFIMLTSIGWKDAENAGYFSAFLMKPVKLTSLYHAIANALSAQPSAKTALPSEFTQLAQNAPLRILVAEDNAVNQKLAVRLLERMGYRPDVAGNGLEVLEALQRQPYDVILMDVQMPEMDGLDATREIRRTVAFEQPHIIGLTASAMQGDREMCLDAGMNDYVTKPIQVKALTLALEEAGQKLRKA